jgi:hypothetical protein
MFFFTSTSTYFLPSTLMTFIERSSIDTSTAKRSSALKFPESITLYHSVSSKIPTLLILLPFRAAHTRTFYVYIYIHVGFNCRIFWEEIHLLTVQFTLSSFLNFAISLFRIHWLISIIISVFDLSLWISMLRIRWAVVFYCLVFLLCFGTLWY